MNNLKLIYYSKFELRATQKVIYQLLKSNWNDFPIIIIFIAAVQKGLSSRWAGNAIRRKKDTFLDSLITKLHY